MGCGEPGVFALPTLGSKINHHAAAMISAAIGSAAPKRYAIIPIIAKYGNGMAESFLKAKEADEMKSMMKSVLGAVCLTLGVAGLAIPHRRREIRAVRRTDDLLRDGQ